MFMLLVSTMLSMVEFVAFLLSSISYSYSRSVLRTLPGVLVEWRSILKPFLAVACIFCDAKLGFLVDASAFVLC